MLRSCSGLFAILLLFTALPAFAAEAKTPQPSKEDPVRAALIKDFPQIGNEVLEINPTPIAGLYEIWARKGLLYFFPDQGYIFVGELYDKKGTSLTKQTLDRLVKKKLAALPLDKAIKVGSGKNVVIEFTDPDCPYCRRGAAYFAKRTDVTRYIFLYPLPMHAHAAEKARFILSSADPAKTYEEVMAGQYDKTKLPEFKDNGKAAEQKAIGDGFGIRSTPVYFVNGRQVNGANTKALDKLLGSAPEAAGAPAQQPAAKPAGHGSGK